MMNPMALALVLFLGLLGTCLQAQEQSFTFKEENFSCRLPVGWNIGYSLKYTLTANRPGGGFLFIVAKTSELARTDDPTFINAFQRRLISDGFLIVNHDTKPFHGFPAFSCTFSKMVKGKLILTRGLNFVVGKIRYNLGMAEQDVDPANDPDFQAVLASFALLSVPG